MSDFLAAQKSFSLEAQTGYDSIQDNGQELEFGGSRKITVRRPDRVRVEAEHRDGGKSVLFFDGQSISVDLPNQNNYASVQKPGTLDAAIDYITKDLGTPQPLADLMYSSVLTEVVDRIQSGFVVGDEIIAGIPSVHLAFRTEAADVQLWIANGEQPLLQRIAITYKTSPGSPKFWAQVTDWDLNAKTPDELFAYTPPEGANQIPIGVRAQEASQ